MYPMCVLFGRKMTIQNEIIDLSNVAVNYIKRSCYRNYMALHTSADQQLDLRDFQISAFISQYYYTVNGFQNIQEKVESLRQFKPVNYDIYDLGIETVNGLTTAILIYLQTQYHMFYNNFVQLEQIIRKFIQKQPKLFLDGDGNIIIGLLKKSRYNDNQIQRLREMLKHQI